MVLFIAAPDHARAGGHGAADSFLVLSGGGRRGRAMGSASPTAGLQQHGEGALAPRCVKDVIEEKLFDRRRDQGGETLGEHGYSKDYRPDLKQMILETGSRRYRWRCRLALPISVVLSWSSWPENLRQTTAPQW
jgi:hypothetical protein